MKPSTRAESEDSNTHSAPKRAAAIPNVPHPQPKSATTLSLTSSNEFSAYSIQETTVAIKSLVRKIAQTSKRLQLLLK